VTTPRRKPNFQEIAAAAGVSPSTVDRVLNERGSVSDAKRRQVLAAARQLGVPRILPSPSHGLLHFDVVLVQSDTDHFRRLKQAITSYAQLIGPRVSVHRMSWPERQQQQMLDYLLRPPHPRHGLVIVTHDSPAVRQVLNQVIAGGVPTVVLTSNVEGLTDHLYVGIDNYVAGRTAGYLLTKLVHAPGPMALLTNSTRYLAHRQRIQGFLDAVKDSPLAFTTIGPLECLDQPAQARQQMDETLADHSQLVGVYNTGAGSAGIRDALLTLPPATRPAWIAHEATPEHSELLQQRLLSLVIDQDPEGQAMAGLQYLLYRCGELPTLPTLQPRFALMTPENIQLVPF
jgi:LacI family transcriptional regulator